MLEANAQARLDGLRTALAALGLLALAGLSFTGRVPTEQPGARATDISDAAPAPP